MKKKHGITVGTAQFITVVKQDAKEKQLLEKQPLEEQSKMAEVDVTVKPAVSGTDVSYTCNICGKKYTTLHSPQGHRCLEQVWRWRHRT